MLSFFKAHVWSIAIAILITTGAGIYFMITSNNRTDTRLLATVDQGPVRQLVSVSGTLRAENTAELGFTNGGTIENIYVRKGDQVATGTILMSLDVASLNAEVADAVAAVAAAKADYAQLQAGASTEARQVSQTTVGLRTAAVTRTKNDEALKVTNALRTLRSDNLAAYSNDDNEGAPAPVISGTYLCDTEGTYTLSVYSSNAPSRYSVRLTGIENGTFPASTEQAIAFGTCGLRATFTPNVPYNSSVWYIDVPNKKSTTYVANKNAYELALANQQSALSQAEKELAVAMAEESNVSAPARTEAVARSTALIAQAEARLERARIATTESTLRAPFAGTVVDLAAVVGETVAATPQVTIVAPQQFELTARLAEIDVGQVAVGQTAEVTFDTAVDSPLTATVDYIAPTATIIDGVAYFEARLLLNETPVWLRGGLNADINIITNEATGLRLPKRFIFEHDGTYSVRKVVTDTNYATTTVTVTLMGNDGFATITGLSLNDTVIAP